MYSFIIPLFRSQSSRAALHVAFSDPEDYVIIKHEIRIDYIFFGIVSKNMGILSQVVFQIWSEMRLGIFANDLLIVFSCITAIIRGA